MKEIAVSIRDKFAELGADIPIEEIEDRLEKLTTKFKVPPEEARRSVVNYFLKEHNIDRNKFYAGQAGSPLTNISSLTEDGKWATIKVKVTQLWDNSHESISQVGLVGDGTGAIKFTKWENSELPDVEEGKSYLLKNVVVQEWNGKFQINLNRTSSIEEIDEDINVSVPAINTESLQVNISDISEDGKWITVRGKIAQLWDNSHESISQVGLIGDETGTIKFTKWENSELPDVEEGKSYLLKNVVAREWDGRFQINLNRTSLIEEISEDIEIGTSNIIFTGAMVDIQSGSGLIKRCPECNRALTKGACMEHGNVKGVYDLRIKAILDDGSIAQDALINREITEQITGMSLDDAVSMAAEALDQGVVLDHMKEKLIGKYYKVMGPKLDRYILVDTIEQESILDTTLLEELITSAEVI